MKKLIFAGASLCDKFNDYFNERLRKEFGSAFMPMFLFCLATNLILTLLGLSIVWWFALGICSALLVCAFIRDWLCEKGNKS